MTDTDKALRDLLEAHNRSLIESQRNPREDPLPGELSGRAIADIQEALVRSTVGDAPFEDLSPDGARKEASLIAFGFRRND